MRKYLWPNWMKIFSSTSTACALSGQGNPAPSLACLQAQCVDSWIVGQNHLKLKLVQDGRVLTAIAFDQAALHPLRGSYDVAFTPQLNFYQGRSQPELLVLDLGRAAT